MAITLTTLQDLAAHRFDDVIDVRAPSEFVDDHLPGAISLPVLDDEERARVGTVYKQVAPFSARKIGAALVSRNAARHLEGPLADKPGDWRPLVYCWRGGQRSGSFATILSQIGWRVETIVGGYKAWRGLVLDQLKAEVGRVIVLDGNTGSAKTEMLHLLAARGVQVIDMEGLANHRGSLFGAQGAQPSQRLFEGRLAQVLATLDPSRPVVVEAESSKVGQCRVPAMLWKAMCAAPRVEIVASVAERARYLARAYADVTADPSRLMATIDLLRPFHPADRIAEWQAMAGAGAFEALAGQLVALHYDPRYLKHRARSDRPRRRVEIARLDPETLAAAADRLADILRSDR
ncbi:tRNA 2-selenouridine(34) synthase MnmH [Falsirhodobacter sp. 20TX0035]|uniref:tRNA 2-selenouridine(34) synthase MnmH n=1 Tax=Falsirhodobacter sp. 20TX0035 TaxID=3022019 RepID=UPI002330BF8D|nr:tRNA 2-selenouridine(34) synthase MnmH [Falsirhodobacter sp. 20TX0035]MDB6453757.1 tRNA 2-selenouridine(34) synthase MnmH [Falsirhodobacter sp. 20TX0035]